MSPAACCWPPFTARTGSPRAQALHARVLLKHLGRTLCSLPLSQLAVDQPQLPLTLESPVACAKQTTRGVRETSSNRQHRPFYLPAKIQADRTGGFGCALIYASRQTT